MSDSITATAGFFQNDAVSPTTATDLETAVLAAQTNISSALAAETAASASATAAAASALSAAGAQSAAATSATNAATSASTATTQAAAAASSATAAASSASSAAADVTSAASSASSAATSATSAGSSATAAANSATNAATSATNAAASATTAANAAATIPSPSGHANQYLRVNGSGNAYEQRSPASVASDIGALHDVGRNKLHNPLFNIWQRGAGPFSTTGLTSDRWLLSLNTDSVAINAVALSDADRTAIADEEPILALQNAFTGSSSAVAFNAVSQRIENVRRLANKTVTVSFYAKANSGTPKVGVSIDQNFGTGGSPSSTVTGNGTAITIGSAWGYYTAQIAIPSLSGKTLGSNGDHCTQLNLWFSSGSNNATRAGSIGVQTNIVTIWGVQLETSFIVTPLEKPDIQVDLAKCQRFYQSGTVFLAGWAGASSQQCAYFVPFPVAMRGIPTVSIPSPTLANISTLAAAQIGTNGFIANAAATASGTFSFNSAYTATADL